MGASNLSEYGKKMEAGELGKTLKGTIIYDGKMALSVR